MSKYAPTASEMIQRAKTMRCIASDNTPLWECPCLACTKLEWQASTGIDDNWPTLREWRAMEWPEYYA